MTTPTGRRAPPGAAAVLAVAVVAAVALAACAAQRASTPCQRPRDPEVCARIRIKCLFFDEGNCTAAGGAFLERGDLCHYCNLCVKFVGAGERCNTTMTGDGGGGGGPGAAGAAPLTAVCAAPLVCSRQRNGTCLRPEDCRYD